MKLVGYIEFVGSVEKQDRATNVMNFPIASDWFRSVRDYFRQEVLTGEYDGFEILINVYRYDGSAGLFASADAYAIDSEMLIHSESIMNPYYG